VSIFVDDVRDRAVKSLNNGCPEQQQLVRDGTATVLGARSNIDERNDTCAKNYEIVKMKIELRNFR